MPTYSQSSSPLAVTTPLGEELLLLTGFRGHETVSQLFSFRLDLLAELKTEIRFDRLVGQNVTVRMRLPTGENRYFNGIVSRLSQGGRDERFVCFRAEMVPKLWLLTKKARSRIFQNRSVPDILHEVLLGLSVLQAKRNVLPARLLRAVSRVRLRLRQPAHGGGRDLLLFRTYAGQSSDGSYRRCQLVSRRPRTKHCHIWGGWRD